MKYPRKGLPFSCRKTQQCQVCRNASAVVKVPIETGIFRGDDEVFRCCVQCRYLSAKEILDSAALSFAANAKAHK